MPWLAALTLFSSLWSADGRTLYAPITVRGVVTDEDGEPVSDATVYLASDRVEYRRLAETKTDADGRYQFTEVDLPYVEAKTPNEIRGSKDSERNHPRPV